MPHPTGAYRIVVGAGILDGPSPREKWNIVKTYTSGCKKASACVIVYKSASGILALVYTMWYDVAIKDGRPRWTDEPERKEEDYDIF